MLIFGVAIESRFSVPAVWGVRLDGEPKAEEEQDYVHDATTIYRSHASR